MRNHDDQHWLLIANGAPLSSEKLQALAEGRRVMVLDGAYRSALQAGLTLSILLGDFDSISPEDLTTAKVWGNLEIIHAPDQNKTDLEKGLDYLRNHSPASIYICAATGHRLQHSLANLRILKKYHTSPAELKIFSETEIIQYAENTELEISGNSGDCLAILGFPRAQITSQGLKYEMRNYDLDFEKRTSVSNELSGKKASIIIEGEALLIHEPQEASL